MEPVTRMLRVCILHPKQIENAALDRYKTEITTTLTGYKMKSGEIAQPTIYLARDHYRAFEKKYGSPVNWRRWMEALVHDRFDVFVIGPEPFVGRATKEIVALALQAGKSVYYLDPDRAFQKVKGTTCVDSQDYTRGWIVVPG